MTARRHPRLLRASLLGALLVGCRGPAPTERPRLTVFDAEPTGAWFSASLGVVDRGEVDPLRDGLALGLTLGQDLLSGPVRPGLELLLEASHHRRRADREIVGLWRFGFGGRVTVDWSAVGATLYVHGGRFTRNAEVGDGADDSQLDLLEGSGNYAGAGLLFWTRTGAVGPFARVYRDEDDDDEWSYGLGGIVFL